MSENSKTTTPKMDPNESIRLQITRGDIELLAISVAEKIEQLKTSARLLTDSIKRGPGGAWNREKILESQRKSLADLEAKIARLEQINQNFAQATAPLTKREKDILKLAGEVFGNNSDDESAPQFDGDGRACISEGDDNGAYIMTWQWLPFDGTKLDKDKAPAAAPSAPRPRM